MLKDLHFFKSAVLMSALIVSMSAQAGYDVVKTTEGTAVLPVTGDAPIDLSALKITGDAAVLEGAPDDNVYIDSIGNGRIDGSNGFALGRMNGTVKAELPLHIDKAADYVLSFAETHAARPSGSVSVSISKKGSDEILRKQNIRLTGSRNNDLFITLHPYNNLITKDMGTGDFVLTISYNGNGTDSLTITNLRLLNADNMVNKLPGINYSDLMHEGDEWFGTLNVDESGYYGIKFNVRTSDDNLKYLVCIRPNGSSDPADYNIQLVSPEKMVKGGTLFAAAYLRDRITYEVDIKLTANDVDSLGKQVYPEYNSPEQKGAVDHISLYPAGSGYVASLLGRTQQCMYKVRKFHNLQTEDTEELTYYYDDLLDAFNEDYNTTDTAEVKAAISLVEAKEALMRNGRGQSVEDGATLDLPYFNSAEPKAAVIAEGSLPAWASGEPVALLARDTTTTYSFFVRADETAELIPEVLAASTGENASVTITLTDKDGNIFSEYELKPADEGSYETIKANGKFSVRRRREYVVKLSLNNVRVAKVAFNKEQTIDAISDIKTADTSADRKQTYNLAGQKVSNGYKGIVIVNGKKVVK